MGTGRWWRGLQARVTVAFAVGSLLLSAAVALISYGLAQSQLISETESQHRELVYANYLDFRNRVGNLSDETDEAALNETFQAALESLTHANGSQSIAVIDGEPKSPVLTLRQIPADLRVAMEDDRYDVAQMRAEADGRTQYWVGIQLPELDGAYYEVVSLEEVESTLASLRVILSGVAIAASLAGAWLGFYSARRALAPVARVSGAARAIASGDMGTRLDMQADADLAVLSAAFNEMVDTVSERIERERRFTSDVSHELRSPLMTLAASVEVLERRKESLPPVACQAVELLSADLGRFQRLVEDLLEISRMEAGAVQLQLSRFGLVEFLENVIFQSRSAYLELEYDPAAAATAITGDKRRLFQVFSNLLENADKYGGGPTGISFEVVGEQVQIVVNDAGPGVDVDDRERIFERFSRVGSSAGNRQSSDGFGLGLSLVAEHVRLHGGTVWVTDRIDGQQGARFVVQLPLGEHIDVLEEMAT